MKDVFRIDVRMDLGVDFNVYCLSFRMVPHYSMLVVIIKCVYCMVDKEFPTAAWLLVEPTRSIGGNTEWCDIVCVIIPPRRSALPILNYLQASRSRNIAAV